MTGKWSVPGIPHKGWTCDQVEDLEAPSAICGMCETQEIRFVHHMSHAEYPTTLGVGCVCAERMENDYVGPRKREQAIRNEAQRRRNWLRRKWKTSLSGNSYLNTDGLNITVFRKQDRSWGSRILDRRTLQSADSRRPYQTEDAAKLGAFNAMIFLKDKGWGK